MIPVIWQLNDSNIPGSNPYSSPGSVSRLNWYGQNTTSVAYACFDGQLDFSGENNVYNIYLGYYNQLVSQESPLEIDLEFSINDNDNFVLNADILITQNLSNQNNKIFFILTNHNGTNYSSTVIAKTVELDLGGSQLGFSNSFSEEIVRDLNWNVNQLRAVAVVQSWDDKSVLQAEQAEFSGLIPCFCADLLSGPASLSVQFTNLSLPLNGIQSWNWDFNGDGIYDSQEENPEYLYESPGNFDVTLQISDGNNTREITWENYIEVNSTQTASGEIAGIWRSNLSPYTVTDSVYIAVGKELQIESGVTVNFDENTQFSVLGELTANAENADPIIFSSNSSWKGISFLQTNEENVLKNCRISNCNTCAVQSIEASLELSDNIISDCSSDSYATALYLEDCSDVLIQGNLISNNFSSSDIPTIHILTSDPDIKNNIIVNNTSGSYGAIDLDSGSNAYLLNNTITHNISGMASLRIKNSFPLIRNCIIWEDGALFSLENGMPSVSYTCITGGYSGAGNIDSNPFFENPSPGIGHQYNGTSANWILNQQSPCVDSGDSDPDYNDNEDPNNPGYALFPARGTIINDIGAFGGYGHNFYGFVGIDDYPEIVDSKMQLSNFPNPFNPSTTIKFALPQSGKLELMIYNIRGQKIKTIFDSELESGYHEIFWNGKDDSGKAVSSGQYIVKLKQNSKETAKKIMMLK